MARLSIPNSGDTVTGWPTGQTRHYLYADALSCDAGLAQFTALSLAQKIAQTTTAIPVAAAGKHWEARNCSGNPDPDPEPGGGGTEGDEPAVNADLSNEEDVTYYNVP